MDKDKFISTYAAIVSTLLLIWEIYKYFNDRRIKLKVVLVSTTETPVYSDNTHGKYETYITVIITNTGKQKRHIDSVWFERNNSKKDKYFQLFDPENLPKFPKPLEPGEKFEYKLKRWVVTSKGLKEKGITELRGVIIDTHKKVHKSKWFPI